MLHAARLLFLLLVLGLVGCPNAVIDDDDTTPDDDDTTEDDDDAVDDDDTTPDDDDAADDDDATDPPSCAPELGVTLAAPIAFGDFADADQSSDLIDAYDCAPELDATSPEVLVEFVPEVDGEYVVALEPFDEDLDLFVLDYDSAAECDQLTCIAYDADEGEREVTTGRSLTFIGQAGHPYLLAIESPNGPSTFAVSVGLVGACPDDRFEPNGDLLLATPMPNGSFAGLKVCAVGDAAIDWYRVDPEPDRTVHVDVAHAAVEGDVELALFDGAGTLLVEDLAAGQDNRSVSWTPLSTAPLFARVQMPAGADSGLLTGNAYAMNLRQAPRADCPADAWGGSSPTNATAANVGAIAGAACPGDDDALALDLTGAAGASLRVALAFDPAEGTVGLELLDPSGTSAATASAVGGALSLEYVVPADGVYVLRVVESAAAGVSPGVVWSGLAEWGPQTVCVDDDAEPNETSGAAALLAPGAHHLCPIVGADEDWFAIAPGAGQETALDLAFAASELDLQMEVYEGSGALVATAPSVGTGIRSLTVGASSGRDLFVRVFHPGATDPGEVAGAAYVLGARSTEWSSCPPDAFEPDESGNPPSLSSVFRAERSLCPAEVDHLTVPGVAGSLVQVVVAFDPEEGGLDVAAVDSAGTPAAGATTTAGTGFVTYSVPNTAAGWDLQITPSGPDGGAPGLPYAITVWDDAGTSCSDDLLGEPNGRLQQAASLRYGTFGGLRLCPAAIADTDFYRVSGRAGEQLRVSVAHPGDEGSLSLQILDLDGTLLASDGPAASSGRFAEYDVLEARDLIVRVHQPAAGDAGVIAGTRYSLSIASSDVGCAEDPWEANLGDDGAPEGIVPSGIELFRHQSACSADPDFTKVTLQPGQRLIANVAFDGGGHGVDLTMEDDNQPPTTTLQANSSPFGAESLVWTASGNALTVDLRAELGGGGGAVYASNVLLTQLGTCLSDSLEPNPPANPSATAATAAFTGLSLCPSDTDAFAVPLLDGEQLDVSAAFDPAEGEVALSLVDPSGQLVASGTVAAGVASLTWTAAPGSSGDHLLVAALVADLALAGLDYDLTLTGTAPPCTDDGDEDDDSAVQALPRIDGDTPALRSCPGDEDWSSASLAPWSRLVVEQTFDRAEGEVDLELVDAAGTPLLGSTLTATGRELVWAPPGGGTPTLRASLAADAGAVGVDYVQDWAVGCREDSAEGSTGNDTASSGVVWDPSVAWTDLNACPGDNDWFIALLGTWNQAEVLLSSTSSEGDLDLAVFPSQSAPTPYASTSGAADAEPLVFSPTLSGAQYVRAALTSDAGSYPGNDFDLSLAVTCPDAAEPNESQATPAALADGVTPALAICGDADWYSFTHAGWNSLGLELGSDPTEGDLDIALYDATGAPLQSTVGSAAVESLSLAGMPAGTYLAQVTEATDTNLPGGAYSLDLQRACPADADEDDDALGAATPRALPTAAAGLTLCPGDADWHGFSVDASFGLDISVSLPAIEGAATLALLDSTGVDVGAAIATTSAAGIDTTTVSWLNGTGGVADVRLQITLGSDAGDAGLPYDLTAATGAVCAPDPAEPANDDSTGATSLTGPTPGSICDADTDWFVLTVPFGQAGLVSWSADATQAAGVEVTLHEASGALLPTVETVTTLGPDEVRTLSTINSGLSDVDLFVRVQDAGPVGALGVDYNLAPASASDCVDDAHEEDDDPALAWVASPPELAVALSACPDDPDVTQVVVPAGETLTSTVTFPNALGALGIAMQDDAGTPLLAQQHVVVGPDQTSVTTLRTNGTAAAENVLIEVLGTPSGDLLPYAQNLDLGVGVACLTDVQEPNDDLASAAIDVFGIQPALTECGEGDWFRYDLAPGEFIDVQWAWDPTIAPTLAATAHDATGAAIPWTVGPVFTPGYFLEEGSAELHNNGVVPLTVYVSVLDAGFVTPGTPYTLEVNPSAGCVPDSLEPNDDDASASVLPLDTPTALRACPADGVDYFAVDAAEWNTITAFAAFDHADGDINLLINDPADTTVEDAYSQTSDELVTHDAASVGTHYVIAEMGAETDPLPGNDYDLTLSVGCQLDPQEPNAFGSPAAIGAGDTLGLTICPGEEDAYSFALPAGAQVEAEALFFGPEGAPHIELHDTSGLLASGFPITGGEMATWSTLVDRTMELRVSLPADAGAYPGTPYAVHLTFNCSDDSWEDNDDFASAQVAQNMNGHVACGGDPDFFSMEMRWWNEADFDIAFANAAGDLTLDLFDPSLQISQTAATTNDGESLTLASPVLDGTWYARVSGPTADDAWPGNSYDLTASRDCWVDAQEPNNSLSNTFPLPDNPISGSVCPADNSDFFDVDLGHWNRLTVDAVFEQAEGDLLLDIYLPNGTPLGSVDTATDDETLVWDATVDDSHRIRAVMGADPGVPGNGYSIHGTVTCQPDAEEPNDFVTPRFLPPGTYAGLNSCAADSDAFFVSLGAGAPVTIDVDPVGGEAELLVQVFDAGGLLVAGAGPSSAPLSLNFAAANTEDHTLQISVANDAGSYPGTTYDLDWSMGCADDAFEPNQSFLGAWPVTPGGYGGLAACPADDDWFSMTLQDWQTFDVQLSHAFADGDVDLFVFDAAEVLVDSASTLNDDEAVAYEVATAGEHRVQVQFVSDDAVPGVPYSLAIARACTDDAGEPSNNFAADADLIPHNSALTLCPGDSDWFSVDIAEWNSFGVTTAFPVAEGNLDLTLLDGGFNAFASASTTTDGEDLNLIRPPTGRYYLGAELTTDGQDPGMGYTLLSDLACDNDTLEPSPFNNPVPIPYGTTSALNLCEGDEDGYYINVVSGDLQVELIYDFTEGTPNAALFDPVGNPIGSFGFTAAGQGLVLAAPTPGQYRLEVALTADAGTYEGNQYDVEVSSPCSPDGFEPNDSQASGTPLATGPHPALSLCGGDEDWFELDLKEWEELTVEAFFTVADGNLDLELYSPIGSPLSAATSTGDDELITLSPSAAGLFAARAFLATDDAVPGNAYDLSYTTACAADQNEPDDTQAAGNPLPPGADVFNACDTDGVDWFDLPMGEWNQLTGTLTFANLEGEVHANLTDAAGNPLQSWTGFGPVHALSYAATSSEVHGLEVSLANDLGTHPGTGYELDAGVDCVDDPDEPDDYGFPVPSANGGYLQRNTCPGDEDAFEVPLQAGQDVSVVVQFNAFEGDYSLQLKDSGGNIVATSVPDTLGQISLLYVAALPDTYRVEVLFSDIGQYPGNAYDAFITPGCIDDGLEDNDTQATASPGPLSPAAASSCPTDSDYFGWAVESWTELAVNLDFLHADADLGLELLDPAGSLLDQSQGNGDGEFISYHYGAAGTLAAHVMLNSETDPTLGANYSIDAAYSCAADVLEPNDSQFFTAAIADGTYAGLSQCGEQDWFDFFIPYWNEATVDLTFSHGEGDINVELQDSFGAPLAVGTTTTDNEQVTAAAQFDESWKIQVTEVAPLGVFPGNGYVLDLDLTCRDDFDEPNDTFGSGPVLTAGTYFNQTHCGDADWYGVSVGPGETVIITATSDPTEGNFDVFLYDSVNSPLDSHTGLDVTEDVSWINPTAATETVWVELVTASPGDTGGYDGNGYTLDVQIAGSCADDFAEDDDDSLTANPMPLTTAFARVSCPADPDWFGPHELAPWVTLELASNFTHASGDIDLTVYDTALTPVASANSVTDNEDLTYPATSYGDHWVSVDLGTDDAIPGNGYDLTAFLSCTNDFAEPNDTGLDSFFLNLGTTTGLSACDDHDWFEFPSRDWAEMTVTVLFDDTEGNQDLYVYDELGIALGDSATTASPETVVFAPHGNLSRMLIETAADIGPQPGNGLTVDIAATCPPDFNEPNETLPTAAIPSILDNEPQTLCPGDEDWFDLYVSGGETLTLWLVHDPGEGDIDVELWDQTGTILLASATTNDHVEALYYTPAVGEPVYARIFQAPSGDAGDFPGNGYDLTAFFGPDPGCVDDGNEQNDSHLDATTSTIGLDSGLRACEFDDDWYRTDLLTGQTLDVSAFFSHAEGDIALELYTSDLTLLDSSNTATDDESVSWTATYDGIHYVKLYLDTDAGVDAGNGYDLGQFVTVSAVCMDDALEDNDNYGGGTFVSGTPYLETSTVSCHGDEDWFVINLAAGEDIQAEIDFLHADADLDLYLYDRLLTQIASSTSLTDDESFVQAVSSAGIWAVKVHSAADTDGIPAADYDLSIEVCPADPYEHNDTSTAAFSMSPGNYSNLTACEFDDDWYSISAAAAETIDVGATFLHSAGNLDIHLFNSSLTPVVGSTSTTDDEAFTYYSSTADTYYLQVTVDDDLDGVVGVNHTLDIDVSSTAACSDDTYEDNDDDLNAFGMVVGYYSDPVACDADPDWFTFSLDSVAGTVTVDISWNTADGQLALYLLDNNVTVVDSDTTGSGFATVSYSATAYEPLLLRIEVVTDLTGGSGIGYDLDLTDPLITAG